MQARFLLGPAGSGKTFQCLAEVREALKKTPEGGPLLFIAPKQATFQLERQLLADPSLEGFTRLQILSFERLARLIFERLNLAPPSLLSEEGRVMVLRALLWRHERELKLFGQSARRPGFAQQLSHLLGELQQQQAAPAKLRARAADKKLPAGLADKLADVALLQEKYSSWLEENNLQDADCLLAVAADILKKSSRFPLPAFRFSGLWMDGFAEMTPQELDLLAMVAPRCETATLAFCLDGERAADSSWLSIWNGVEKTFQQCRQRFEQIPGATIKIEVLARDTEKTRFANNSLRRLEACWQSKTGFQPAHAGDADSVLAPACPEDGQDALPALTVCTEPAAETMFAAREILKFVRQGNRFRDCAIIVRNLDNYHKPLARTFRRYGIPFFLDRRESIAHHPLAELTRSALRTVAFDWRHEDWFAALKTGFWPVADNGIDRLENAALEYGWEGKKWLNPLPDDRLESIRTSVIPPFQNLFDRLAACGFGPDGKQLADWLRRFWDETGVEPVMDGWLAADAAHASRQPSPHQSVLEQMDLWLDNLALGFSKTAMPLRDWLPVLEAGLAHLTVGVIPPVLDEVLIGAIDRARNPDLKFVLVLGANEGVLPALPAAPVILTDAERDALEIFHGSNLRDQVSRERFYGYLAFTRASERLAITFSGADADGKTLGPSSFISHLRQLFPGLEVAAFNPPTGVDDVESATELLGVPALAGRLDAIKREFQRIPAVGGLWDGLQALREPDPQENLSAMIAGKLYGPALRTSVSRLEDFAQCPFRFFVRKGLQARERKQFDLDPRERGNFQHELLKKFHEDATRDGRRWRDLEPEEARNRVRTIAEELAPHFRDGILMRDARSRFAAKTMTEAIGDFIVITVHWLRGQNRFDPAAAELAFGGDASPETAWEIPLNNHRLLALEGRIDRIDLCRDEQGSAPAIVIDYKAGGKRLDPLLVQHGIQLQLLAYLNVLRHWKNPRTTFGVDRLVPAGVFYVNLRGQAAGGNTRAEVLDDVVAARRAAYRHLGRFDAGILPKLDSVGAADQFNYRINQDGSPRKGSDALPRAEFEQLLDEVEGLLRRFGEEIYAGRANLDPYRKGSQKACDYCEYSSACRIDPWTHEFRTLK